jgi:hypothetical protein
MKKYTTSWLQKMKTKLHLMKKSKRKNKLTNNKPADVWLRSELQGIDCNGEIYRIFVRQDFFDILDSPGFLYFWAGGMDKVKVQHGRFTVTVLFYSGVKRDLNYSNYCGVDL